MSPRVAGPMRIRVIQSASSTSVISHFITETHNEGSPGRSGLLHREAVVQAVSTTTKIGAIQEEEGEEFELVRGLYSRQMVRGGLLLLYRYRTASFLSQGVPPSQLQLRLDVSDHYEIATQVESKWVADKVVVM
jgi:hypothetical protein